MSVETITNNATALETLQQLGQQGKGIRVAVIDGAIDHVHPLLSHLNIASSSHTPTAHGTAVCSLIAGQGVGLAPEVEILNFPVFQENAQGQIQGCSERSIAKAIEQARKAQCDIINISAASLSPNGVGTQELREAVADCNADGILIISAVGNEGRNSESVPAALEGVLAVGACDKAGNPSAFNNYGSRLRGKMLLASGEEMPVAMSENNIAAVTGSSFATPIVSAICVLVYNALQLPKQNVITPKTLRTLLFETATLVPDTSGATNAEYSRLNIPALLKRVEQELSSNHSKQRSNTMSNTQSDTTITTSTVPIQIDGLEDTDITTEIEESIDLEPQALPATADSITKASEPAQTSLSLPKIDDPASHTFVHSQPAQVTSQALVQTDPNSVRRAEKVFVLGSIGYDFGSEARMDYFSQEFKAFETEDDKPVNEHVPSDMADFLNTENNASKATGLIWTLKIDGIPVYAIEPENQFAIAEYTQLVQFIQEQYLDDDNKIERVSIAGAIIGETRLLNGHTVPTISPILRGMFSWNTHALFEAVYREDSASDDSGDKRRAFTDLLHRIYYELRNKGLSDEERAINYAATNAYNIKQMLDDASKEDLTLNKISAESSPICRPESICIDVIFEFFNPKKRLEAARKLYRSTVDVSDLMPVTIGELRSWRAY